MIDDTLLPVGSCIKVRNYSKTIMIAGYLPADNQKKIMYDYIGIYVPIGIRKSRQKLELGKDYICFNNSDIEKVIFIGFSNDKKFEIYHDYLLNIKNSDINEDLSLEEVKKILEKSLPNLNDLKSEGLLNEE